MKIRLALVPPTLCILLLTGCVEEGVYVGGGYNSSPAYYGYGPVYQTPRGYYEPQPYYMYRGVPYYTTGGRYYYLRNQQRYYVTELPRGGTYWNRSPNYYGSGGRYHQTYHYGTAPYPNQYSRKQNSSSSSNDDAKKKSDQKKKSKKHKHDKDKDD